MASLQEALQLARDHHSSGRLQQAEQIYWKAHHAAPDYPVPLYYLGVLAAEVGNHEAAIELIQRAIVLDSSVVEFHKGLARPLLALGRFTEAEQTLLRVLELAPHDSGVCNQLGSFYASQGKIDAAIRYYRLSIQHNPDHAEAYNNLANVLKKNGQTEEAIECYQRAITINPGLAAAYNNLGNALTQQGELNRAIEAYERAIESDPNLAEAIQNIGKTLQQQGKLDEAKVYYKKSLSIQPNSPEAISNLGSVHNALGEYEEAKECFEKAIELNPHLAVAYNNLGNVYLSQGLEDEAIEKYRYALSLTPNYAQSWMNLGVAFDQKGEIVQSIESYNRAIEINPEFAEAYTNLGSLYSSQGEYAKAVTEYQHALRINPHLGKTHSNLGNALINQGNFEEGINHCRFAVEIDPVSAEAHNNLANALFSRRDLDEAEEHCRQALTINPKFSFALNNLGNIFKAQLKLDEALECYGDALEQSPDFGEVHLNRGIVQLLKGDFEQGWKTYEWRRRLKKDIVRQFSRPEWQGESLYGKTLLLHDEQGIGDAINFIRYASLLAEECEKIVVFCQDSLHELILTSPYVNEVISDPKDAPPIDFHKPILSLPGHFRTNFTNIPNQVPYLFPTRSVVEQWAKKLKGIDSFRVGISWQGNPKFTSDQFRSIPLKYFKPLSEISGVELIKVQKGFGTEQIQSVEFPIHNFDLNLTADSRSLMETAALLMNLDLLITSDTAVAHLAGSIGVPVWVAIPFVPDWRWFLDREDSPWYPTMRLFRPRKTLDWENVFFRMCSAIQENNLCGVTY